MELKDVVMKLIGNIEPVGSTDIDEKRFENLVQLCDLTEELIFEIEKVATDNKDRPEYSMKKAGEYASMYREKYRNVLYYE
jgi:hypothetical protein